MTLFPIIMMKFRLFFLQILLATAAAAAPALTIVIPYAGADRLTTYWAAGEDRIDWQRPALAAERCTTAFAATELRDHLAITLPGWTIRFSERIPAEGPAIVLGTAASLRRLGLAEGATLKDPQSYTVKSISRGGRPVLVLAGGGREGALYAAYAYLGELGWRWFAPGKRGVVAPPPLAAPRLDNWSIVATPDFPIFRGFLAAAESIESNDMFLWMARNRLNSWPYRPRTYGLMRKLGFRFVTGGHILEQIMDPDAPQPHGRSLFEEHRDWFPEVDGKRVRENADKYQFCVSNPAAMSYVARRIAEQFGTEWRWTDFQNVWMLDTWKGWCQCPRCRALGGDADRYLHFLSHVRAAADAAVKAGKLARTPAMLLAAYEGTPALDGPDRDVPASLVHGKDAALYAPINRCYAHTLNDPACTELNAHYARSLEAWGKISDKFPLAVVEYYNNSKIEDLPVLFSRTMGGDFAYYHDVGVRAITYMQVPTTLEGPRALTQFLFARLAWDSHASVDQIKDEYFRLYYGAAGRPMREFYDHQESAWANIGAWRSWYRASVLWKLLHWEPGPPTRPLYELRHLQPQGGSAIGPQESLAHLDQAAAALRAAARIRMSADERFRVEEDTRCFRYGDDSFRFLWAMAQLYQAEMDKDTAAARRAWSDADRYAASLVSYYVPFWYAYPGMGVSAKDGLERTQLRPLLDRLREKYAPLE
jgi:hypothetical protein